MVSAQDIEQTGQNPEGRGEVSMKTILIAHSDEAFADDPDPAD